MKKNLRSLLLLRVQQQQKKLLLQVISNNSRNFSSCSFFPSFNSTSTSIINDNKKKILNVNVNSNRFFVTTSSNIFAYNNNNNNNNNNNIIQHYNTSAEDHYYEKIGKQQIRQFMDSSHRMNRKTFNINEPADYYHDLKGEMEREIIDYALSGEIPKQSKQGYQIATFAGGCFWGVELLFQRHPDVIATCVGYTQGKTQRPTYKQICQGNTGHTEAIQVFYKDNGKTYEALCDLLWGRIDPTLVNRQGNDYGTQYRAGIYTHTDEQMEIAKKSALKIAEMYSKPLATEIMKAQVFWPAEDYHQQYLEKGGNYNRPQSAEKNCKDTIRCYG